MQFFFLDASALAKRYAPETGTSLINHLFASVTSDRLCVFNVSVAEILSALVRKRNAGGITSAGFVQALADFRFEVVQPIQPRKIVADNLLVTAAFPLIESHSINATDGIILRAALDLATPLRSVGDDLVLVAADQRLIRAAQAEGLTTFNPETQSQAELDALLGP